MFQAWTKPWSLQDAQRTEELLAGVKLRPTTVWRPIRALTEVKLPEVIQSASLHPPEHVKPGRTEAAVGNAGVRLSSRGTAPFNVRNVPSFCSCQRLQLQLIKVIQVPENSKKSTQLLSVASAILFC